MFLSETEIAQIEENVMWALVEDDWVDEAMDRLPIAVVALLGRVGDYPGGHQLYREIVKQGFSYVDAQKQTRFKKMLAKGAKDMDLTSSEQKTLIDYAIKSLPGNMKRGVHYGGVSKGGQPTTLAASLELGLGDELAEDEELELSEKAPPGWAGTVKAMKKHMDADKAFALAWTGYKQGKEPHYKDSGSTKAKGEPVKKKKYQDEAEGGDGCPCGDDHDSCGCKTCKKLKAKERTMREAYEQDDDDFLDTSADMASGVGDRQERAVPNTPGPIGKPNTVADQRAELGAAKGSNSISSQLSMAIGRGVSGTGPSNPGVDSLDPDRGDYDANAFNWPNVIHDYQDSMGEDELSADDLFNLALAEDGELGESVSLPAETMAIANYLASKHGEVGVSELRRRHGMTEKWAKKLLALAKAAFRGAGVPRSEMRRREADPARWFREKVHPVLVAMHQSEGSGRGKKNEDYAIGDGALAGTQAIGQDAGYELPYSMGGNEDLASESPVDRDAAAAMIQDAVKQDSKTAKMQTVAPWGIGRASNPTKYTAESLNDYPADDRIRMAEAYDRLVGGAPDLSKEELVDAEHYKALVTKHASRVAGQSSGPASVRTTQVSESMMKVGSEKLAKEMAKERGQSYGFSALNGKWYVGDAKKLKKIGVAKPMAEHDDPFLGEDVEDIFPEVLEAVAAMSYGDRYAGGEKLDDILADLRTERKRLTKRFGHKLGEAKAKFDQIEKNLAFIRKVLRQPEVTGMGLGVGESVDDAFEDALVMEGGLGESTGHHFFDGKHYYADTAFMNNLSGVVKDMSMDHMGFGEFVLRGRAGEIDFDRMRGKDFPHQSGRSHQVYDNKGGKLVKKVIAAMEKAHKSELIKEDADLDEAVRVGQYFVIVDLKTGKAASKIFHGARGADAELKKRGGENKMNQQVMDAMLHNPSRAKLKHSGMAEGAGQPKRQAWMSKMQSALLKLAPKKAGKIDWGTATHLFNAGDSPEKAAKKMAKLKAEGLASELGSAIDEYEAVA